MRRETRYATPRKYPAQEVPNGCLTALVCGMLVAFVVFVVALVFKQVNESATAGPSTVVRHDSLGPTHTYDGEIIRWYVFTDPDTQVQYLVNDRGGCVLREKREVG